MGLTGAMFTSVSGLNVNQTWLNVIGNNVANANTTAFKSSRVLMTPQFYVTDTNGTAPTADFGGTNPSQEGLGATVQTVQKDFSKGSIQPTGQQTDMAINGDGFFVVKANGQQLYTRDGAFTLNSSNQLVNTAGGFVQGYGVDVNGTIQTGSTKNISIPLGATQVAKATQNAIMQGNLDGSGAPASGASVLLSQDMIAIGGTAAPVGTTLLTQLASATTPTTPSFTTGETITLQGTKGGRTLPAAAFNVTGTSTVQDMMTFFQQNMGIDTTVPTTTPPPGVTLEAGTAPNSAHFVIAGNTGSQNALQINGAALTASVGSSPLSFADGTNAAGVTSNPAGESVYTSFTSYDSLGNPVEVDVTAVLQSRANSGNTWQFYADSPSSTVGGLAVGSGTLTFNNNGNLVSSTGNAITVDRSGTGAFTPLSINLDFSRMTELSGQTSTLVTSQQDGFPAGTLESFSVGSDGTIAGAYSNGQTRTLGQVAVATFNNNQGLSDQGGNLFAASAGSGAAQIGFPGSLGAGAIDGASLEQSNVDLSKEFTNMIVASAGFSASSRVITTSNQMIQELLNTAH
jgi:flagellar hook protein FlgE